MRSATSFFNATLFRRNLQRFWPIWGLYAVIWLLLMPVNLLLAGADRYVDDAARALRLSNAALEAATFLPRVALGTAVLFGLLAAAAVFSYLFSARSTGGMHSLPIRREGLFLTNYLSGLSFLIVPNVVVFLLTLLAEAALDCLRLDALGGWLLMSCACCFIFYSLAVFCAVLTGHIVAVPVFYGIANILAIGFVFVLEMVLKRFVFGFGSLQGLEEAAMWLTPIWQLRNVTAEAVYSGGSAAPILTWDRFYLLGVYALAALVLTVCALLLYRRRQMERAGDVVAAGWLRPVFRYGVAACSALVFGMFFFRMFSEVLRGVWSLLLWMALCGAAGYFIASMLLEKTPRVLRRWKGCAVFLLALVGLVCLMEYDAFGFERWTPDADEVLSVTVSDIDSYPRDDGAWTVVEVDDPETIRLLVSAHEDIVARKQELKQGLLGTGNELTSLTLVYRLRSGAVVEREYNTLLFREEEVEEPGTFAAALEEYLNLPATIRASYGLEETEEMRPVSAGIEVWVRNGAEDGASEDPSTSEVGDWESTMWMETGDSAQAEAIWQAVQQDMEEGTLGRRTLLQAQDSYVDAAIEMVFYSHDSSDETKGTMSKNVYLQLTAEAEHTLQALRDAGMLDRDHYLVMRETGEMLY